MLVACGSVLVACGAARLDTTEMRSQIASTLRTRYAPASVGAVTCPGKVRARKGASFRCTVDVGGVPVAVTVKQTDAEGSLSLSTDKAVIVVAKVHDDLTHQLQAAYRSDSGVPPVTVDCGPDEVQVLAVGAHLRCTAATPAGSLAYQVRVRDTAGTVEYQPVA